jgi:hypothetical protein
MYPLHCREGVQLMHSERGEVAWGGAIIPQNITHVNACGKTVGKACITKTELQHLVLEFFVGHSSSVTINDAKVGCRDFLGGGVAVGRCCVEHAASTCGIPFLCLVLLFRDFVVFLESLAKMIQVGITNLLNGKAIDS